MTMIEFQNRREAREPVEMMARFRHDITTITVMLKDITPHGARVEGVGKLEKDEPAFLMLPGLAPKLSFIVWSNGSGAGLEFAESLDQTVFRAMVADFGRRVNSLKQAA